MSTSKNNWKVLQLSDGDILNGKPNSMSCCAIALAFDREECMNRDGKFEPGMSHWVPEIHHSDEMYIQKEGEGAKNYFGVRLHPEDRDDVQDFIDSYDNWGPHGGGDMLDDFSGFRFRYQLEHISTYLDKIGGGE